MSVTLFEMHEKYDGFMRNRYRKVNGRFIDVNHIIILTFLYLGNFL